MPEVSCPSCEKGFWVKPFRLSKLLKNGQPACSVICAQQITRKRIDHFLKSAPRVKCACGCGQLTMVASRTFRKKGIKQGDSFKFLLGHNFSKNMTTMERFMRFVDKTSQPPCWIWTGSHDQKGYGMFHVGNGQHIRRAHIVSYQMSGKQVPRGFQLDHICRVKSCVNPSHVEPVTLQENIRRAFIVRTSCKRGHPYSEGRFYIWKGSRHCNACRRITHANRANQL